MTAFRLLISYHYFAEVDLDEWLAKMPVPIEIFADSGGYSANSQGVTIAPADYAKWLHRWKHLFAAYASLDEIADPERSWRQHQELLDLGVDPLPVFHGGEPWAYLERYLADYRYMCVGGMVGQDQAVLQWLIRCQKMAREAGGCVFHAFGQTRPQIVNRLPFYSIDSSSWSAGHRFGVLNLWDDDRMRWVKMSMGNRQQCHQHGATLRSYGLDPALMGEPGVAKVAEARRAGDRELEARRLVERKQVLQANALAWLRWEAHLRRLHGPISLPARHARPYDAPEASGPALYYACSSSPDTDMLVEIASGPKLYLVAEKDSAAGLAAQAAEMAGQQ